MQTLHMFQLMPLPLTVSCFSKIQIGFAFLLPTHLGSPRKRAVKHVCVCVCDKLAMTKLRWKTLVTVEVPWQKKQKKDVSSKSGTKFGRTVPIFSETPKFYLTLYDKLRAFFSAENQLKLLSCFDTTLACDWQTTLAGGGAYITLCLVCICIVQ